MLDVYIFGFGLVVTLLVGTGLVTMIVVNNRALDAVEAEQRETERPAPAPVSVDEPRRKRG